MASIACLLLLLCEAANSLRAQTFRTIFTFDLTNGEGPSGGLIQSNDGELYGTTAGGGYSAGTVFKVTTNGVLTTLYNFKVCTPSGCPGGTLPHGSLTQAADGDVYGATGLGGAGNSGTVFRLDQSGTLTTLHSFCPEGLDTCTGGYYPIGGLVEGTDGNLYGTTTGNADFISAGTVFKITRDGTLTTLYTFCSLSGCADGKDPGPLVQATNGDFYGVTMVGGSNNGGTVFRISPEGALVTLHSFCAQVTKCTDGSVPYSGLIQAVSGELYGTASEGGVYGFGTVFKITLDGTLTTIHDFHGTDGSTPAAGLVQGSDGNLYGTTYYGGGTAEDRGTIFRITPAGLLTKLYTFCSLPGCTDGLWPNTSLYQATNGNFYGTNPLAGLEMDGSIFEVSVGLSPFIRSQPTSGNVGETVKLWGNVAAASSVTFNGTAAAFEVDPLSTSISAIVPAGATSGAIQVATPNGTLSSNVPFQVLQ
jgi:uncharacterized repeat protein (TIGR03803 family)